MRGLLQDQVSVSVNLLYDADGACVLAFPGMAKVVPTWHRVLTGLPINSWQRSYFPPWILQGQSRKTEGTKFGFRSQSVCASMHLCTICVCVCMFAVYVFFVCMCLFECFLGVSLCVSVLPNRLLCVPGCRSVWVWTPACISISYDSSFGIWVGHQLSGTWKACCRNRSERKGLLT